MKKSIQKNNKSTFFKENEKILREEKFHALKDI